MKMQDAKKAKELIEEIELLEKYWKLFEDKKHGKVAHFEAVQHYGTVSDYEKVIIPEKYNQKFKNVLDEIIKGLHFDLYLVYKGNE